jgi:glutamine synthetase type III
MGQHAERILKLFGHTNPDKVVSFCGPEQEYFLLADLRKALEDHSASSAFAEAEHARDELLPAMTAVRTAADTLEGVVADDLWPLPTYQEMLYIL